jgi:hypothetical protein
MENKILEKAFDEVKEYIVTKDMRLKKTRNEISLAKQEFLAELKDLSERWFDKRVKFFIKREV